MRELTLSEVEEVSGGAVSDDTSYGVSVATAGAFLIKGMAMTNPVGAAIVLGASLFASGMAIYYVSK